METSALAWIGLAAMIVSLFLIPLGLPGVWIMIAILFLGVVNGMVSGWIFFLLVVLAGLAEFLEFVAVGRMTARYGGTNRTFWGAVVGGLAGALMSHRRCRPGQHGGPARTGGGHRPQGVRGPGDHRDRRRQPASGLESPRKRFS